MVKIAQGAAMTKKHFIELADVIKNAPSLFSNTTILALACYCGRQSPKFKAGRWLGYIAGTNGPNGGKVCK